jgi:hypothetical protein
MSKFGTAISPSNNKNDIELFNGNSIYSFLVENPQHQLVHIGLLNIRWSIDMAMHDTGNEDNG